MPLTARLEIRLIDGSGLKDLRERARVSRFARRRQPLHAVFVGARLHSEQFRHASVELADRIRIENLFFERDAVPFAAPFAAAAQVARPVQCDHRRIFEGRRQVSRGCVRRVVVDRDHARFREHRRATGSADPAGRDAPAPRNPPARA